MLKKKKWVPAPRLVGIHPNPGPKSGTHLNEEIKWRVVFLWKDKKLSPYSIAKKLKIDKNSASSIIEKYKETKTVHDRPHPGRKRKLSASDTKEVIRMAKKRKFAPEIARSLGEKVSERTVQRTLKRVGYFYRKVKKIEKLTNTHKKKRVEYCKEMKGSNWSTVLFSDEKTFQLGAKPEYAWQTPEDPIVREYVQHAPKLHVWGAIGSHVQSELFFFQENLNSELYQKILKKCLNEKNLIYSKDCPKGLKKSWQFCRITLKFIKLRNQ
jgi:transposase